MLLSHEDLMIDQRKLMFHKKDISCELDFQPNDQSVMYKQISTVHSQNFESIKTKLYSI